MYSRTKFRLLTDATLLRLENEFSAVERRQKEAERELQACLEDEDAALWRERDLAQEVRSLQDEARQLVRKIRKRYRYLRRHGPEPRRRWEPEQVPR